MNKLFTVIFLLLFVSCNKKQETVSIKNKGVFENSGIYSKPASIHFTDLSANALILGRNIKLLDTNFLTIKNVSFLNEKMVQITAVSSDQYKQNKDDDYCKEFRYVKIKSDNLEGIIDGRFAYREIFAPQNKNLSFNNESVIFKSSKNFSVGVSDSDGLTGCEIFTPVIITDPATGHTGPIRMVKNKLYNSDYPYFELKDDNFAHDEITNIEKKNDEYRLTINRVYQEDRTELIVFVSKANDGQYIAEILEDRVYDDSIFVAGAATMAIVMFAAIAVIILVGVCLIAIISFVVLSMGLAGIISTAVITILYKRSVEKGFRLFLMLSGGFFGLIFGIVLTTLLTKYTDWISFNYSIPIGAVAGLLAGISTGAISFYIVRNLTRRFFHLLSTKN